MSSRWSCLMLPISYRPSQSPRPWYVSIRQTTGPVLIPKNFKVTFRCSGSFPNQGKDTCVEESWSRIQHFCFHLQQQMSAGQHLDRRNLWAWWRRAWHDAISCRGFTLLRARLCKKIPQVRPFLILKWPRHVTIIFRIKIESESYLRDPRHPSGHHYNNALKQNAIMSAALDKTCLPSRSLNPWNYIFLKVHRNFPSPQGPCTPVPLTFCLTMIYSCSVRYPLQSTPSIWCWDLLTGRQWLVVIPDPFMPVLWNMFCSSTMTVAGLRRGASAVGLRVCIHQ